MSHGDGVDKLGISAKLEACPCTIAVTDCDNLLVLLLQCLSVLLDLGIADVLAVTTDKSSKIEVLRLLGVRKRIRVDDLAIETIKTSVRSSRVASKESLQVRDVDGRLRLLREVVGNQTNVRQGPAEDVGDDEDSGILGVARDVGLDVVQCGLLARGSAVPLETGFAVFARHCVFRSYRLGGKCVV